jgi:transcriptional regulator with XRE-family HTH domain
MKPNQLSLPDAPDYELYRIRLGLSQAKMCDAIGITQSTYFRWRRDGITPTNENRVWKVLKRHAQKIAKP